MEAKDCFVKGTRILVSSYNIKNSRTKGKNGHSTPETATPPQKRRRFHFLSTSSSSGNRGGPLQRKYRLPTRQATHRHIAIPTTSITSLSVRCRFLRRHNKLLRREGNHYQLSSNDRTVGVPIQPKHRVSSSMYT